VVVLHAPKVGRRRPKADPAFGFAPAEAYSLRGGIFSRSALRHYLKSAPNASFEKVVSGYAVIQDLAGFGSAKLS
jgi:hypothetical protein